MNSLKKLISIGMHHEPSDLSGLDALPKQLRLIYELTDGLFAFESALHIFPLTVIHPERESIAVWNGQPEFINTYHLTYPTEIIFAEDAIGGQFILTPTGIYLLDLETNEREYIAPDIEKWAKVLLENYEYLAAFTLAHDWQTKHGSISVDCRLSPSIPFILGGEFNASNLHAVARKELLRFRAAVYEQIRDLPSGSAVKLSIKS